MNLIPLKTIIIVVCNKILESCLHSSSSDPINVYVKT